jgi:hypothetical protein
VKRQTGADVVSGLMRRLFVVVEAATIATVNTALCPLRHHRLSSGAASLFLTPTTASQDIAINVGVGGPWGYWRTLMICAKAVLREPARC